ncbi:DMT family transporter [Defluviimonas sp. WL0002]|uniref:DMT family transporter n=1 Tax=Albidovulum marisflavi TaxID=2984159 RepID=A0ABT2ZFH6_9RHOB|nr:DMT family transporter [Defluviimonas sp. WL0002]MCV2869854.1 DMT family transporter [Defluviimonas sp. WL0002]
MLASHPRPTAPGVQGNVIAAGSMLIWAAGFPAGDVLLEQVAPLHLATLRMLLAAAFLLPLWLAFEGRRDFPRIHWRRVALIGAVGFGATSFLLTFAQSRTDGVTVAIVSATTPVIGIALECLLDGRRLTRRLVAGLVLTLTGGTAAYAAGLGSLNLGLGALAMLASVIIYCWGSRAAVVDLAPLSPLGRAALPFVAAGLTMTVISSAADGFGAAAGVLLTDPDALTIALFYGMGSIGLSHLLWLMGVERLGIGIASMHFNAAPFYVMMIAWALGGGFNWAQALGALVVLAGVLIAQGRAARSNRAAAEVT